MTSFFARGCIFSEALQMYYMLNYRSLKCSIKWYTDLTLIIFWIVANLIFIYVLANYANSGPGECWTLSSSFFFLTMRLPYYTSLTGLNYRFEYNSYKKLVFKSIKAYALFTLSMFVVFDITTTRFATTNSQKFKVGIKFSRIIF